MITPERAIAYLKTHGMTFPPDDLAALLVLVGTIEPCLETNYPPEVVALIQLYLLGLLSFSQYTRYISSQSAPNGASRSFRYTSLPDTWRGLANMLAMLDPKGCASGLIPAAPFQSKHAALFVGVAGPGMCGEGAY